MGTYGHLERRYPYPDTAENVDLACGPIIGYGTRIKTIHPPTQLSILINLVNCMKCGKEIDAGKEVKKGWITKKTYHSECTK
jgi:hypothetical protein